MIADDVPQVAHRLMERHGLIQRGWTFQWDNAKRRAGRCRYGRKEITLSRHYVALNVADRPDDVIDTILHEIAHALVPPKHGHDDVWKAKCVEIGARPVRCLDSAYAEMPKGKLVATCAGCGRVYRRHKQLKAGTWSYCRKCGPKLGRLAFIDSTDLANIIVPIAAHKPQPPQPRKLRGGQ